MTLRIVSELEMTAGRGCWEFGRSAFVGLLSTPHGSLAFARAATHPAQRYTRKHIVTAFLGFATDSRIEALRERSRLVLDM